MIQRKSTIVALLLLSLATFSLCFDSYYGTIDAVDCMTWIQQSQPAADGSDSTVRWFLNKNDASIDPATKAAADAANDINTPWRDPRSSGKFTRSFMMKSITKIRVQEHAR